MWEICSYGSTRTEGVGISQLPRLLYWFKKSCPSFEPETGISSKYFQVLSAAFHAQPDSSANVRRRRKTSTSGLIGFAE